MFVLACCNFVSMRLLITYEDYFSSDMKEPEVEVGSSSDPISILSDVSSNMSGVLSFNPTFVIFAVFLEGFLSFFFIRRRVLPLGGGVEFKGL